MRGFVPLLFQTIVCTSRNTHLAAQGVWNITRSSNPMIATSTLIKLGVDHSFELVGNHFDFDMKGYYDAQSLPYIRLWMRDIELPVGLKVVEIDTMDRLYVEQGIWDYVFERVR